jgi:hypothetical protein
VADDDLMVSELIARDMEFAAGYYRKHGRPMGETDNIRAAVAVLKRFYGYTQAADFGPEEVGSSERRSLPMVCPAGRSTDGWAESNGCSAELRRSGSSPRGPTTG